MDSGTQTGPTPVAGSMPVASARPRPLMAAAPPPAAAAAARPVAQIRKSKIRIPQHSLIMYTRQLATMYKAGVAIVRSLEVLAHQTESPDFQMVIFAINSDLLKGRSFSAALGSYPKIFNPLYISMVKIGEMEGDLGEALERVAEFLEKDYAMRKKVQSAMTYPVVVFCFALAVAFFMFNYLLPHFVKIFEEMNTELPLITKLLMDTVRVAQNPLFIFGMPILMVVAWIQFSRYIETDIGRLNFDQVKLHMPIFGPIVRKVAIARMARSLGTLVMAGINTILAMDLAGQAAGNEVIRLHLKRSIDDIKMGKMLSACFVSEDNLFPVIVRHMISAGEESGKMDAMLEKLAHYYEVEVEHALAELSSLLEPILILFTGIVVGFIVLAIFLPLYGFLNKM